MQAAKQFSPRALLFALACACSVLYVFHQSPHLDDVDAANFALGVRDFNPLDGRPHPPGFPAYIFLAKCLRPFFRSDTATLTAMSTISGLLLIPCAYTLLRTVFSQTAALSAVFLFFSLPLTGLESTKAMTDMPGLLAGFASVLLASRINGRSNRWALFLVGIALGATGGVRPHVWLFAIPASMAVVSSKNWPVMALGFAAGVAAWLVPTCFLVGPGAYFDIVWKMFFARFSRADISLIGSSASPSDWLRRFFEFPYIALYSGFGIQLPKMSALDWIITTGLVLFSTGLILRGLPRASGVHRQMRWGLAFYFLYLLLFLPPTNARYLLPLFLWGFAEMAAVLFQYSMSIGTVVVGTLVILLFLKSVPLLNERDNAPPPSVSAVLALKELNDVNPIFLAGFRHSYFKYYWPEASFLQNQGSFCETATAAVSAGKRVYASSVDNCATVTRTLWKTFERNPQVHWKDNKHSVFQIVLRTK